MSSTNERIKKLRKALDLTQTEFAKKIGSTANVLTNYETGRRNPSSSVVNNICKTFHVSEEWLRTGVGEMFVEVSRDEEIEAFVNEIMQGESDSFRRRFIAAVSQLDDAGWEMLELLVEAMAKRTTADGPPDQDQHAIWEAEARAEAEEYYREILEEKKQQGSESVSYGFDAASGDKLA